MSGGIKGSAAAMSGPQIALIALCVLLNALDGFDAVSISFAAPGIASDMGIGERGLGLVLSSELVGMSLGSFLLGAVADRLGRRHTVLGCLALMTIGMGGSAMATGISALLVSRVVTGFGIGGMLPTVVAIAAEFSNDRRRSLAVALVAGGTAAGVVGGGSVAAALLVQYGWRSIFVLGVSASAMLLLVSIFVLPESIAFLLKRGLPDTQHQINRIARRLHLEPVDALPDRQTDTREVQTPNAYTPALIVTGILLTVAYLGHMFTYYFMLKWTPKIVVDMGFSASTAGSVFVLSNLGGVIGGVAFGLVTQVVRLRSLLIGFMVAGAFMVALFGRADGDFVELSLIVFITGFFTNGALVGSYALMAESFPVEFRATGTGIVTGLGRSGSALGPILAGYLFARGWPLAQIALTMAAGSIVAAAMILLLHRPPAIGAGGILRTGRNATSRMP